MTASHAAAAVIAECAEFCKDSEGHDRLTGKWANQQNTGANIKLKLPVIPVSQSFYESY